MCTSLRILLCECMCLNVCERVWVCMCVCICVSVCVCIYVSVCVCRIAWRILGKYFFFMCVCVFCYYWKAPKRSHRGSEMNVGQGSLRLPGHNVLSLFLFRSILYFNKKNTKVKCSWWNLTRFHLMCVCVCGQCCYHRRLIASQFTRHNYSQN